MFWENCCILRNEKGRMFLVILFFIELFHIRILLFCCCFLSIYPCDNSLIDRAEWLYEASWLGQPSWLAFQKRSSSLSADLM